MSEKAVFVKDIKFENGPLIPRGTEGTVEGIYICALVNGRELTLPDSVIEEDGRLKMPYITLDNSVIDAGTVLEVIDIIVAVGLSGGVAHVSRDDVLISLDDSRE